jgi:AcrR family transcriptional regulator
MATATSSPPSPPRTYDGHRERQRRRILDASEKLFDDFGIDRVTMAEITTASGVRASTVYQYFSGKDEIVWAILARVLQTGAARAEAAVAGAKTALEKITAVLELMADDLTVQTSQVRFLAQFDAMYARDWPAERLLSLEAHLGIDGFNFFADLVREGIADGSLRPDLRPELTLHAIMNAVAGAQRRLASLGNRVELEYGQPIDSLFRETLRIILLGLRATQGPAEKTSSRAQPLSHRKKPNR